MTEVGFRDGDLVLVTWHTSGVALAELAATDPSATVFIPGPTMDRDCALSVAEFARRVDNVQVRLGSPRDAVRDVLELPNVGFVPAARAADYPVVMRGLAATADRVVGIVETSPPADGTVTPGINGLGVSTIRSLADVLVAEVNPREPRLPGLSFPASTLDHRLPADFELPRLPAVTPDERALAIGRAVADVVPDGATLHIGYGSIPTAVADALSDHSDLGLHSGMVSPTVVQLIEDGVVTRGSTAASPHAASRFERPGLATTTVGTDREFYDWLEETQTVGIGDIAHIHDPCVAAENPRFTAINSGVEVDVFGQVNAERVSDTRFGGPGGQPDFYRIARRSEGGRGILALTSTLEGEDASKIVGRVSEGGVVTTPAYDIDTVVTEYGIADLRLGTDDERARRLIDVAAPSYRNALAAEARAVGLLDGEP